MFAKKSEARILYWWRLNHAYYCLRADHGESGVEAAHHVHKGSAGQTEPFLNMVIWTEQFASGSDVIDQQHRMLINNINHLEGMLNGANLTREEAEFLVHLVDFLESYAGSHFKFEEACMERYRCPAHARNKRAHEQFIGFFEAFKKRYQAEGLHLDLLRQLHQELSLWIQEHILSVDTQLRPCIRG